MILIIGIIYTVSVLLVKLLVPWLNNYGKKNGFTGVQEVQYIDFISFCPILNSAIAFTLILSLFSGTILGIGRFIISKIRKGE